MLYLNPAAAAVWLEQEAAKYKVLLNFWTSDLKEFYVPE
jgi:hypothetical protein